MYSTRGTVTPTATELISATQIVNDVTQAFGTGETTKPNYRDEITLTDLSPGAYYDVFVVATDRAGNTSEIVETIEFRTL